MAAAGGDPVSPFSSICYRRHRKPADRNSSVFTPGVAANSSGHALSVPSKVPSLGFDSASKKWDNIPKRKVKVISFLPSLDHYSENSVIASKMAGDKLNNPSMEPTEQKEKTGTIVLDSDVPNKAPSLEFGSASKEWDNIQKCKVEVTSFVPSLDRHSENSIVADKMAGGKLNNPSMEPTEQKEKADIIVLDSNVSNKVPSLEFGSTRKEWGSIRKQEVQLMNLLSTLQHHSDNFVIARKMAGGKLNNPSMGPTEQKEKTDIIVLDSDVPNKVSSLEFGSASKEWDNIRKHENSVIAGKIAGGKLNNRSMDPTEQKEKTDIIVVDSDDEDGKNSGYNKLAPKISKELISEFVSNITKWVASNGMSQAFETMDAGDKISQIFAYGQSAALVNQLPLQPSWQPSIQFERVVLQKRPEDQCMQELAALSIAEKRAETQVFPSLPMEKKRRRSDPNLHVTEDATTAPRQRKRKSDTDSVAADLSLDLRQTDISSERDLPIEEEEKPKKKSDGLEEYWKDFALAVESAKLDTVDEATNEKEEDNGKMEDIDCNHDIRIHEDLGHVCRICGMIVRRAESIIDYQWKKASRRRTSSHGGHSKDGDDIDCGMVKLSEDFIVADIAIHPRHAKKMRPHQLEGFNFLIKNLTGDKPGGCILAHAPGSGKTFMLISFIQSFLARYPSGRPLVVLPKGILGTWKKEIQQWQVQDIPLYDFYSVKATKRVDQLEVLKSWEDKMSILFLGYKQFSTIISDDSGSKAAAACRDRLLKVPNLLIMDEGHTPRNPETDVLVSLNRVETPRKVVLSGTLFQNHVAEVFAILNLVRPKFLRLESSRPIVRRIMSQVNVSGRSSKGIADSAFTDSVEGTLFNDGDFKRKAHVIRGLRELTKDVLHYYKGDILDELPGLLDFSVFLKLTPMQKEIIQKKMGVYDKFKRSAVDTSLYVHPCLSEISEVNAEDRANTMTDKSVDSIIDSVNVNDGVKARFFMNILSLANSAGEKLLAFCQYKAPMKFLERLLVKMKGWHVGKEIFMITGETHQEDRELLMDQFNNSADAKVMFGSIKACGEGISLVGASRVVILDVHLNPAVTRQAIGRAFRPGQQKKVFVYRLVAADSAEEKHHETAFKKEVTSKLLFEWSERCTTEDFKLGQVDIDDCMDELLDTKAMRQDIKALYKR